MNWRGKILNAGTAEDRKMMRQVMRCAENARGTCAPNPFVGAVVVKNGMILSRGWTQHYGGDHAEVQALNKAGAAAKGSDLYVTLEPCAHHGKTPPCTDAIIKAGIKKVCFGIYDPNPLVNGKGAQLLAEAGIEVVPEVFADKIRTQLEYYLCRIEKKRPFVIWKAALSLDGKYAAQDGSSRWISGERSRRMTHKLRQEADVVLTGLGTVLIDDPLLNVRLTKSGKQPLRAVLDTNLQIPLDAQIIKTAGQYPTAVFCGMECKDSDKARELTGKGVCIIPLTAEDGLIRLDQVLGVIQDMGGYCILLECGSILASSFFSSGYVDKCVIFYGGKLIGGDNAVLKELDKPNISDALLLKDIEYRRIGEDIMITGYPEYH
jgi:diaminohydroxyphosphoribosylaminopyrimidine deaminase / 5-amino-6-(5-phosphoribosylamino)uracil reductase